MSTSFLVKQIQNRAHEPIALDTPMEVSELATPALILNKPIFEQNVKKMANFLAGHNKGFRPHAKTHKCAEIARRQLAAGAVGICVAKLSEAVAMRAAGVEQILITSPLTTSTKVDLLVELASDTQDLNVVVDSRAGLELINKTINATIAKWPDRHQLGVLIDLDIAMGRTGVRSGEVITQLIDQVNRTPQLNLVGFQHYAGHVMHIAEFQVRKHTSLDLWQSVEQRLHNEVGISLDDYVLTGAGTGTYNIDIEVDTLSDLQVGSYIFMDEEYRQIEGQNSPRFEDFGTSLTLACTAISSPTGKAFTFDGGYKAFASDTVKPVTDQIAGAKYHFAGDEHGVLVTGEGEQSISLGTVHQFVTPHCDPTVNLHEYYWVQEADGLIHSCWPINGRGCSW